MNTFADIHSNTLLIAVDGVWLDWSEWSTCSVTCGNGTQFRNRTCDGPYHGGADCVGDLNESRDCSPRLCPGRNTVSPFKGHRTTFTRLYAIQLLSSIPVCQTFSLLQDWSAIRHLLHTIVCCSWSSLTVFKVVSLKCLMFSLQKFWTWILIKLNTDYTQLICRR